MKKKIGFKIAAITVLITALIIMYREKVAEGMQYIFSDHGFIAQQFGSIRDGGEVQIVNLETTQVTSEKETNQMRGLSPILRNLSETNEKKLRLACLNGHECIPAIDNPIFVNVNKVNYLKPEDLLISIKNSTQYRLYPLRILAWHQAVNDEFFGKLIVVTYSPLTGITAVYERKNAGGEKLDFGVSEFVLNNEMILFDRASGSKWDQLHGLCLTGKYTGESLDTFDYSIIAWKDVPATAKILKPADSELELIKNHPYLNEPIVLKQ